VAACFAVCSRQFLLRGIPFLHVLLLPVFALRLVSQRPIAVLFSRPANSLVVDADFSRDRGIGLPQVGCDGDCRPQRSRRAAAAL